MYIYVHVYDSSSLLYYTHLFISLSGNSTVVLMLSVKHSIPTLNKVDLILSYLIFPKEVPCQGVYVFDTFSL